MLRISHDLDLYRNNPRYTGRCMVCGGFIGKSQYDNSGYDGQEHITSEKNSRVTVFEFKYPRCTSCWKLNGVELKEFVLDLIVERKIIEK